jgi:hypothetical protein
LNHLWRQRPDHFRLAGFARPRGCRLRTGARSFELRSRRDYGVGNGDADSRPDTRAFPSGRRQRPNATVQSPSGADFAQTVEPATRNSFDTYSTPPMTVPVTLDPATVQPSGGSGPHANIQPVRGCDDGSRLPWDAAWGCLGPYWNGGCVTLIAAASIDHIITGGCWTGTASSPR